MSLVYLEYDFKINPLQPATDILIAELGELGFESFVENETGLLAYILKSEWRDDVLEDLFVSQNTNFEIEAHFESLLRHYHFLQVVLHQGGKDQFQYQLKIVGY